MNPVVSDPIVVQNTSFAVSFHNTPYHHRNVSVTA